jgi:hypothetical protein
MRRSQPADCAQRDDEQVRPSRVDAGSIANPGRDQWEGEAGERDVGRILRGSGLPKTLRKDRQVDENGDGGRRLSGSHLNGRLAPGRMSRTVTLMRAGENCSRRPLHDPPARGLRRCLPSGCAESVGLRGAPAHRARIRLRGANPHIERRAEELKNRWHFNLKLGFRY